MVPNPMPAQQNHWDAPQAELYCRRQEVKEGGCHRPLGGPRPTQVPLCQVSQPVIKLHVRGLVQTVTLYQLLDATPWERLVYVKRDAFHGIQEH